jgi:small subunit ribosomal protein S6
MRQYEVTFIVDPVLSGDGIKATAQTYVDMLQQEGCTIVHTDEMGLRQLAYPIKNRNSGVYYCVEFQSETGSFIPKMELALSRDERIMRFLTVSLDKFGVKYNEDKRKGLIGRKDRKAVANVEGEGVSTKSTPPPPAAVAPAADAPVVAAAIASAVSEEE